MKPGRFEKSARFVLYLPSTNNQKSWFSRHSEVLNLNVSDESLVDKYISVFLAKGKKTTE